MFSLDSAYCYLAQVIPVLNFSVYLIVVFWSSLYTFLIMSLNVLLVDDDPGFRRAVRRLSEKESNFNLIGEAENGEQAVRLDHELRPQVIFMDITMPRLNGLEATRRIKANRPDVKVIILSVHEEEAYRRAATESGADGFVLKKTILTDLNSTMRRAHATS